eukprot:scaffold4879_cov71-Cyclotella_meneghiniana.AAC.8
MKLSTLITVTSIPQGTAYSRRLQTSDTRPTRPNIMDDDRLSSSSRPNANIDDDIMNSNSRPENTRPENNRPASGVNSSNNSNTDDENYLPNDDEYYLPPNSLTAHVFAAGNSDDWGDVANNSSNNTTFSSPVLISKENVISIAAGQIHSVMLTDQGVLLTGGQGLGLGRNYSEGFVSITEVHNIPSNSGNVFNGDTANKTTLAKEVSPPPRFAKVYASQYFTIALDENGNLWSTGSNSNGQLCLGDNIDRDRLEMVNPDSYTGLENSIRITQPPTFELGNNTPVEYLEFTLPPKEVLDANAVETNNNTKIIDVALGERHTLLLRQDGVVFACGWNEFGQLGLDSTESSILSPSRVILNEVVEGITAGRGSSYLLTENNTIYVTGTNFDGQLCLGNREDRPGLTLMDPFAKDDGLDGSNTNIHAITAGKSSLYILLSDGQVLSCGDNTHGQLGMDNNSTSIDIPTLIPLDEIVNVFSGPLSYNAFFVQQNGSVHAAGYNGGGQLGTGDGINRNTPAIVACSDSTNIDEEMAASTLISSSNDHTLFLGTEDTFLCDGSSTTASPTATLTPTVSPTTTAKPTGSHVPTTSTNLPTVSVSVELNNSIVPTTTTAPSSEPSPMPSLEPNVSYGVKLLHAYTYLIGLAVYFVAWV